MNTQYLLTPTLIQSWQYWYNYDGEKEKEVGTSFLLTLQRQEMPTTEAMQKGIDFENQVIQCAENKPWECAEVLASVTQAQPILDIAQIISNGMFQVVLKKNIKCCGNNFLLYGKADVIKEDTVFDIKYTQNYDIGKFSNSVQHLLYMYCAELNNFEYLVSDGDNFWKEGYYFTNKQIQSRLLEKIYNFYSFLQNNEKYLNIFKDKWKAN